MDTPRTLRAIERELDNDALDDGPDELPEWERAQQRAKKRKRLTEARRAVARVRQ